MRSLPGSVSHAARERSSGNPIRTPDAGRESDADFTGRWVALGAFLVLTVAIVLLVHIAKVRRTREPFRWPVFEMAVSSVAFVAWATALTDTPLRDLSWYKGRDRRLHRARHDGADWAGR